MNIFTENPFISPAKKIIKTTCFKKADLIAIATLFKNKEYFKNIAIFISKYSKVINLTFNLRCPAIINLYKGRLINNDIILIIN